MRCHDENIVLRGNAFGGGKQKKRKKEGNATKRSEIWGILLSACSGYVGTAVSAAPAPRPHHAPSTTSCPLRHAHMPLTWEHTVWCRMLSAAYHTRAACTAFSQQLVSGRLFTILPPVGIKNDERPPSNLGPALSQPTVPLKGLPHI